MPKTSAPRKPRILLLSAYDAGSHRRWREQLVLSQPEFEWHVLSLSPRFFRWRIRGNALTWLNEPLLKESWDLLLVTSMVDLSSIRGFHPNLAYTPALIYMRENQFAYLASDEQHNSIDPQMVNLYSAIAAEAVVLNSDWSRRSFLNGIEKLFRRLPDGTPEGALELIAARYRVLPVPIDDRVFHKEAGRQNPEASERLWGNGLESGSCSSPPKIVWVDRWEYDKGPDRLLAILQELDRKTMNFQACILGERVLLHAAASGLGTAVIQIATAFGNPVFATAGDEEKLKICRKLGAAGTWNRKDGSFVDAVKSWGGVDMVLDPVGGSYVKEGQKVLSADGRIVLIGLMGGRSGEVDLGLMLMKRQRLIGSTLRSRSVADKGRVTQALYRHVSTLLGAEQIEPMIDSAWPIEQIEDAMAHVAANRNTGKVVLKIAD